MNRVKKNGHGIYRQCIHVQLKRWTSNTIHFDIKKQYLQATKCYSAQTSPNNSSPFTECDIQSMLVQKADAESKGLLFLSARFHCCPPSLEVQKRGYWSMTLNIQRRNRELLNPPDEDTTSRQWNLTGKETKTKNPTGIWNTPYENMVETVQQYWPKGRFHACEEWL